MTENLQENSIQDSDQDNSNEIVNEIKDPEIKGVNEETKEVTPDTKEEVKEESKEVKDYPDDWRERIAKDDEKVLKKLQRLKTPEDLAKSYLELEKKLSETRPKFQLPENPTPEDIAKYREENGVPEKAENYDLELDGGLVIGEYDKPIIDEFVKIAHDKNMPAGELKKAVQSYFEARAKSEAETTRFLEDINQNSEKELRETWGDKINEHKNKIATFLEVQFGKDEAQLLDSAVFADGTNLSNNPKLLNKFLDLANKFHATPSDSASNTKVNADRLAEIEKYQKTNRDAYFKNEEMQQEYRELLSLK
jgi:hypothetical protein